MVKRPVFLDYGENGCPGMSIFALLICTCMYNTVHKVVFLNDHVDELFGYSSDVINFN